MFSKSSTYAIRGVLYLALNSNEEKKLSPKIIAKEIGIPAPFLAKTLQLLTKKGLVASTKGRRGGFYLTAANKKNNLLTIVDCIDGLEKFNDCILGLPVCSNENPCPLHAKLVPLRQAFVDELAQTTIAALASDISDGKSNIITKVLSRND